MANASPALTRPRIRGLTRGTIMTLVAGVGLFCANAAAACTVSPSVTSALGPYSPAAVQAGAVPALQSRGGLTCPTAVLSLLSANYIRARFRSQNGFVLLQQSGSGRVSYTASADPAGTYKFTQGSTIDYMQNNLLNLLGLLGGSSADLPFFVQPIGGTRPPVGSYRDRITIDWSWYQCPLIGALGLCVGIPNQGSGTSTIDVTLTVSPVDIVVATSWSTTWDPVNTGTRPKALPGARLRSAVAVANTDIVPLDANSLAIVVPTPVRMMPALDGDGATSDPAIRIVDGAAAGLAIRYAGPSDMTDDVDFSSDGGTSWTAVPIAGDAGSQGAISHVRLRPQGAMIKQSRVTVSLSYQVR